jgi:uncharacterized membrane protein YdbT with pleckstrin-like domain
MRCPQCGTEVVAEAVFCHKCGARMSEREESAADPPPRPESDAPGDAKATERFQEAIQGVERQAEPERELWRGGYSPKAMVGAWLLSGLIAVALLLIGIFWKPSGLIWLILVLLMILPWLYFGAILCYRRWSVRYLLTSQRFIHEQGILRRVSDRIEVLDIDDVTFEQSLIDRFFAIGTIRIASSDRTHPLLALRGIENVRQVADLIDETRRSERRRRGLHIESI